MLKGKCKIGKGEHKMPTGKMMKDSAMVMMMSKEKPKAKKKTTKKGY
jgi:hypothetical protein